MTHTVLRRLFPTCSLVLALLFAGFAMPEGTTAQTPRSHDVSLMGRWAEGPSLTVTLKEDFAYIGNGAYLEVVDTSNPADPAGQGRVSLSGPVRDVTVAGDYAYVASGIPLYSNADLQVIDISNPADPQKVGTFADGSVFEVAVAGDHAYLAVGGDGLRVLDISDPANPEQVGHLENTGFGSSAEGVAVAGDYVYIANDQAGLRVADVSDPANPQQADNLGAVSRAKDVFVRGDSAYVAMTSEEADDEDLQVIDVSTPTNSQYAGAINTDDAAREVAAWDNHAYLATSQGLRVIDVSSSTDLQVVGSFTTEGQAEGVAVAGDYAYVAGSNGLRVLDVSNPANPQQASIYETGGEIHSVASRGGYVYLATDAGLQVLDVSNPASPEQVGSFATEEEAEGVAVAGDYAYVAGSNGLRILDVSDPANPQQADSLQTDNSGTIEGIALTENYAYVANQTAFVGFNIDLQGFDISDFTGSEQSSNVNTGSSAVEAQDGYLYVADGDAGLQVLEVSDPANSQEVGSFETSGRAMGVAVAGDHAYVADGSFGTGLVMLDISTPSNPQEVGSFSPDDGSPFKVTVAGDYAYLANQNTDPEDPDLHVLAVSDSTDPQQVGSFESYGSPEDVAAANGSIYFANQAAGLYVLERSTTSSTVVSSDGSVDFRATGVNIDFSGVSGSGEVAVERFDTGPSGTEGISEENVSDYRFVIEAGGDLSFDASTEVRFDVSTLAGVDDPSDVTIYTRSTPGEGSFTARSTSYDADANELVATTGSFSEFVFASNTNPLPTEDPSDAPQQFALEGNAPNPFAGETTIRYALPKAMPVTLTVYDVLGRKVATLVDQEQAAGRKQVRFEAEELPAGVYVYRLQAGDFSATRRMVVVE